MSTEIEARNNMTKTVVVEKISHAVQITELESKLAMTEEMLEDTKKRWQTNQKELLRVKRSTQEQLDVSARNHEAMSKQLQENVKKHAMEMEDLRAKNEKALKSAKFHAEKAKNALHTKVSGLEVEVKKLNTELTAANGKVAQLDNRRKQTSLQNKQLKDDIERITMERDAAIKTMNESISNMKMEAERARLDWESKIAAAKTDTKVVQQNLDAEQAALVTAKEEIKQLQAKFLEEQRTGREMVTQVDLKNEELNRAKSEIAALKKTLDTSAAMMNEAREAASNNKKEAGDLEQENRILAERMIALENKLETKEQSLASVCEEKEQLMVSLEAAQHERDQNSSEKETLIRDVEREREDALSRLEALKEEQEEHKKLHEAAIHKLERSVVQLTEKNETFFQDRLEMSKKHAGELADKQSVVDTLKDTIVKLEAKSVGLEKSLQENEQKLTAMTSKVEAKDKQLEVSNRELQEELLRATTSISEHKSIITSLEAQLTERSEECQKYEREMNGNVKELINLQRDLDRDMSSLQGSFAQVVAMNSKLTGITPNSPKTRRTSASPTGLQSISAQMHVEVSHLEHNIADLVQKTKSLEEQTNTMSGEIQSLQQHTSSEGRQVRSLEKEKTKLLAWIAEKDAELKSTKEELSEASYEVERLGSRLSKRDSQLLEYENVVSRPKRSSACQTDTANLMTEEPSLEELESRFNANVETRQVEVLQSQLEACEEQLEEAQKEIKALRTATPVEVVQKELPQEVSTREIHAQSAAAAEEPSDLVASLQSQLKDALHQLSAAEAAEEKHEREKEALLAWAHSKETMETSQQSMQSSHTEISVTTTREEFISTYHSQSYTELDVSDPTALKRQLDSKKRELEFATSRLNSIETSLRTEVQRYKSLCLEQKQSIDELTKKDAVAQHERTLLDNLRQDHANLCSQLATCKASIADLEKQLENERAMYQVVMEEKLQISRAAAEEKTVMQQGIIQRDEAAHSLRKEAVQKHEELVATKATLEETQARMAAVEQQLADANTRYSQQVSRVENLQSEIGALSHARDEARQSIAEVPNMMEQVANLQAIVMELERKLSFAHQDLEQGSERERCLAAEIQAMKDNSSTIAATAEQQASERIAQLEIDLVKSQAIGDQRERILDEQESEITALWQKINDMREQLTVAEEGIASIGAVQRERDEVASQLVVVQSELKEIRERALRRSMQQESEIELLKEKIEQSEAASVAIVPRLTQENVQFLSDEEEIIEPIYGSREDIYHPAPVEDHHHRHHHHRHVHRRVHHHHHNNSSERLNLPRPERMIPRSEERSVYSDPTTSNHYAAVALSNSGRAVIVEDVPADIAPPSYPHEPMQMHSHVQVMEREQQQQQQVSQETAVLTQQTVKKVTKKSKSSKKSSASSTASGATTSTKKTISRLFRRRSSSLGGNEKKEGTTSKTQSSASLDVPFVPQANASYLVTVQESIASTTAGLNGKCTLCVDLKELSLTNAMTHTTSSWPISHIKRYGLVKGCFFFEIGDIDARGPAKFQLTSPEVQMLFKQVDYCAKNQATA